MKLHIKMTGRLCLYTLAPLCLGISFVISTGSLVQTYVFSLLNGQSPSIYGLAYKEAMIAFPPFRDWIKAGVHPFYLIPAVIIGISALSARRPKVILWRSAIASALVLTAMDTVGLVQNFRWLVVGENLVANLLGGLLIGCLIVAALSVGEIVFFNVPAGNYRRLVSVGGGILATLLLAFAVIYFALTLFYKLMPVEFDAYAAAPLSGGIRPLEGRSSSGVENSFSLVNNRVSPASVETFSMNGKQVVAIEKAGQVGAFDVFVSLLSGSCDESQLDALARSAPVLKLPNVQRFTANFDEGASIFKQINERLEEYRYSVNSIVPHSFHLSLGDKEKDIQVSQFFESKGSVTISDAPTAFSFALFAPVAKIANGQVNETTRDLMVVVDGKKYIAKFSHNGGLMHNHKVRCSAIPINGLTPEGGRPNQATVIDLFAGLLVTIKRSVSTGFNSRYSPPILVSGVSGWINIHPMRPRDLAANDIGGLSMIQLKGNVTEILVNSSPVIVRPQVTYTAVGRFTSSFGDDGKLRVTGTARKLWRDQSRLNPTKWEVLSWEARTMLLGTFGGICAFLWSVFVKTLRNDQRLICLN